MAKPRRISVTVERCMGCHTCELACSVAHTASKDLILAAARGEKPGFRINVETFKAMPVPIACQHCEEPACVMACPTGAVHRNAEGKPVLMDTSRCIGCTMCVQACPFGMMAMTMDGKFGMKCDLCVERLAKGLQPACSSSCPTGALHFEEEEVSNRGKRQSVAQKMVAALSADRPA
jgi:carbon-monoxide dehydrogenase iron sulfur subunit